MLEPFPWVTCLEKVGKRVRMLILLPRYYHVCCVGYPTGSRMAQSACLLKPCSSSLCLFFCLCRLCFSLNVYAVEVFPLIGWFQGYCYQPFAVSLPIYPSFVSS